MVRRAAKNIFGENSWPRATISFNHKSFNGISFRCCWSSPARLLASSDSPFVNCSELMHSPLMKRESCRWVTQTSRVLPIGETDAWRIARKPPLVRIDYKLCSEKRATAATQFIRIRYNGSLDIRLHCISRSFGYRLDQFNNIFVLAVHSTFRWPFEQSF